MIATRIVAGASLALITMSAAVWAEPILPKSPIAEARTAQAKAVFSVRNPSLGKFTPFFAVDITIGGPGRFRIDATPQHKLRDGSQRPSFFFMDGVKQYEFNALSGKYKIADMPRPGERPMSQLYSMAAGDAILHPGTPPRYPGVTRTITEGELDGRKTIVYTDRDPVRKTQDGRTAQAYIRTWFDAANGLPIRQMEATEVGDATHENLLLEFKDWTFNKPVSYKTFAWTVPDGAVEDVPLKLLAKGTTAPDFVALTPEGKEVRLSDYRGKVVVLDFWATWCGPCQQSMPHLQKIYDQVKDKGVEVLAVCVWDKKAEYDKWLAAKKGTFTFPTLFDPAGQGDKNIAGGLYQVSGIPTQYVIDREGKIAAAYVGFNGDKDTRLEVTLGQMGVAMTESVASRAEN